MVLLNRLSRPAIALLVAGLVMHLASAFLVFFLNPNFISPESDQYGYKVLALNIIDHGVFSMLPPPEGDPMLLRTPGYPAFLAGLYALDRSGLLVVVVQQLLLVISAALTYLLMRHFKVGEWTSSALLAFLLIEPMTWLYSLQTMTETLALFLWTLLLAVTILSAKPALWRAVLTGGLIGFMPLVKPNLVLFGPLALALFLLLTDAPLKKRIMLGAVVIVVALAVLAPWLVRNTELVGSPVLSSSPVVNFIVGLGTYAESLAVSTGVPIDGVCCRLPSYDATAFLSEVAVKDAIIAREGFPRLILEQVVYAPRVYFDATFYVVLGEKAGIPRELTELVVHTFQTVLFVFIAGGLSVLFSRHRAIALLFFLAIASVLLLNVRISYSRMLIPLYPVFAVLAGLALTGILGFLGSRRMVSKNQEFNAKEI